MIMKIVHCAELRTTGTPVYIQAHAAASGRKKANQQEITWKME